MKILLIKMSSMGDVIHTLPALTDARTHIPNVQIDWVVEPAFADIPRWHPAVNNIIVFPQRHFTKNILKLSAWKNLFSAIKQIRATQYDLIIDAQGLLKSAWVARIARGVRCGLNAQSAREPIAHFFYQKKYLIEKNLHAILRTRLLFSAVLNYRFYDAALDYGIDENRLPSLPFSLEKNYFIFLHGTTWDTKHYPEIYWKKIIETVRHDNIKIYLPWGNKTEKKRAENLARDHAHVSVLPALSIATLATVLKNAKAVVSVDTGLGHLAAALNCNVIALYGPTNPEKVGMQGQCVTTLRAHFPCAPCAKKTCDYAKTRASDIMPACFKTISPEQIVGKLRGVYAGITK